MRHSAMRIGAKSNALKETDAAHANAADLEGTLARYTAAIGSAAGIRN